ncbi:hypothetical protein EDD17DRAFT_900487 [Pisolithus thermaeus]|nr:hypothetical protein EDD17DRAFT_900487 [Pisolithus thermaeus]
MVAAFKSPPSFTPRVASIRRLHHWQYSTTTRTDPNRDVSSTSVSFWFCGTFNKAVGHLSNMSCLTNPLHVLECAPGHHSLAYTQFLLSSTRLTPPLTVTSRPFPHFQYPTRTHPLGLHKNTLGTSYPFTLITRACRPARLSWVRYRKQAELRASGVLDHHAAHVLADHPSCTLSDHTTYLFRSHATHIPNDRTTSGEVDDYGSFDESKFNSERIVGLPPQLLSPPNQLPPPPHRLHVHSHVSHINSGSLPGTSYHGHRFATAQPRTPTKLPKARSVCDCSTFYSCG